jgi:phosphoribosylformimino-5-aminoimidazole carboxamide ribotide isomerase
MTNTHSPQGLHILPALDLLNGQVVRLHQGDFQQPKVYHPNPPAQARKLAEAGLQRLHIVDLNGARAGEPQQLSVLAAIRQAAPGVYLDYSGGIQRLEHLQAAFVAGADAVALGTVAATSPNQVLEWIVHWGADRFLLAADLRNGRIAIRGWEQDSGLLFADFFAPFQAVGVRRVFCTAIEQDGTLQGPALSLYQQLLADFPELELIASGGIATVEHLHQLQAIGCWGAIVGRAYYEGRITAEELAAFQPA